MRNMFSFCRVTLCASSVYQCTAFHAADFLKAAAVAQHGLKHSLRQ